MIYSNITKTLKKDLIDSHSFIKEREEGQDGEEEETEVKRKTRKPVDTAETSAGPTEEVSSERTRTSVPVVTCKSLHLQ